MLRDITVNCSLVRTNGLLPCLDNIHTSAERLPVRQHDVGSASPEALFPRQNFRQQFLRFYVCLLDTVVPQLQ